MDSSEQQTEAKTITKEVAGRFLIGHRLDGVLSSISAVRTNISPHLSTVAEAFEQNISAVVATVGIPLTLAADAAHQSHWQRIYSSERIRSLMLQIESGEDQDTLEKRRNKHAIGVSKERMREFANSPEGAQTIAVDICRFLLDALAPSDLDNAADELLRQGIVLTWSALEVLCRDLFEVVLNSNPKLALSVIQEPTAKQRLQSKFTLEDLAAVNFDLSHSLGSLFTSQQDFSDIRTIKAVILPALNNDSEVEASIGNKVVWLLCQQRHLIVHRRGVVDTRYLDATGEKREIGKQLVITPKELATHIKSAVNVGNALLIAASKINGLEAPDSH